MGRKLVFGPHQTIINGDMSQATVSSDVTNIQFTDNICVELAWTGTPTGTFQVLGSVSGNNFVPINFAANNPAGSAGSALFDLNQLSFPLIQIVYTKVSGTGTLNAWIGGKEI